MHAWVVEIRKHLRVFGAALTLVAAVVLARAIITTTVTEVAWVFGVMLTSFAISGYAAADLYRYVALRHDLLLHMSTRPPSTKLLLKICTLGGGVYAVFVVSQMSALLAPGVTPSNPAALAYVFGAKLVSLLSFLLLVVAGSAAARRAVRATTAQIALLSVLVAIVVGLQLWLVWSVGGLSGQDWSVGVSNDYLGLPLYANVLPVTTGEAADGHIHSSMTTALVLNLVMVVLAAALGALDIRRPRAFRALPEPSATSH